MTRLRTVIAAALLLTAAAAGAQTDATFNVATYNIRQLNQGDDRAGNGWERRRPHVAALIRYHDFDIFGTQEGFREQLDSLQALLPDHAWIGVGRDDGRREGEHSAIFYRTDKFDILDHGDFWLSETPDRPGLGWDAACVRICTWGHFRHKASGKEFLMFNLHMDHVGTEARRQSALLIKQKILELDSSLPALLTGDFNVDQTSEAYRTVLECGLVDSHDRADIVYEPNGTFCDYRTDSFSRQRIDHIFLSPEVEVSRYGILTDTYRTREGDAPTTGSANAPSELELGVFKARTPSDHFPVAVTITLP